MVSIRFKRSDSGQWSVVSGTVGRWDGGTVGRWSLLAVRALLAIWGLGGAGAWGWAFNEGRGLTGSVGEFAETAGSEWTRSVRRGDFEFFLAGGWFVAHRNRWVWKSHYLAIAGSLPSSTKRSNASSSRWPR